MRKWLILLSALSVTSVSGAPAWTWVDANGTVHYSDTPVPGAKQIELTGAQGFGQASRAQQQSSAATPAAASATPQAPASAAYRTFNILSPGQQETLWNIGTNLNVQIALEPRLQPTHRLDVFIDGQRRNLNATGLNMLVPNITRGIHTMQAVIVDQGGTEVLRSLATTFMVQQTSIQNPNAPLAKPQPPVKPQPKVGN
jgi:Domain of unknown function (DUF4124)